MFKDIFSLIARYIGVAIASILWKLCRTSMPSIRALPCGGYPSGSGNVHPPPGVFPRIFGPYHCSRSRIKTELCSMAYDNAEVFVAVMEPLFRVFLHQAQHDRNSPQITSTLQDPVFNYKTPVVVLLLTLNDLLKPP